MTRTHHKTKKSKRFQFKNRQHTTCIENKYIENLSTEPISRKK